MEHKEMVLEHEQEEMISNTIEKQTHTSTSQYTKK